MLSADWPISGVKRTITSLGLLLSGVCILLQRHSVVAAVTLDDLGHQNLGGDRELLVGTHSAHAA